MNKKHLLLLSIVLFGFALSLYIYNSNKITVVNNVNKKEILIHKNQNTHSETKSSLDIPDWCLNTDGPECYSENIKMTTDTETTCDCDVSINGKKYIKSFNVKIQIKENLLSGMMAVSSADIYAKFLSDYCDFRCNEMKKIISDETNEL